MIISALFFSALALLSLPIPIWRFRYYLITRWSQCFIFLASTLCQVHFRIHGKENIPKTPSIVAVKHQSSWETLFMQCLLPPQIWIMKRELLWIPIFGWTLALLKPIAINRKNKKLALQQILTEGKMRLAEGIWIVIFPEGTRVRQGQQQPYGRSASALAAETGALLLPIAHNAGVFWKGRFLQNPGVIDVVIGPALDPQSLSREALHAAMVEWIEQTTAQLPKHPPLQTTHYSQ